MDTKNDSSIVICGARCVFRKDGKCHHKKISAAAVIGIDGKCVRFETSEEK